MAVKFKAVQKKNPQKRDEPAKWYPQAVGDGETRLQDLADYASSVSTVSKADILAVLETVFTKVSKDLSEGHIVHVGEYFTLQMGLSGLPSDKEEEVNATKVKSGHILFRPGKMLSDMVKLATFKKL
ncbi:HU family DNA-binding protein [Capnocytophaga canimorsus]|uniref:DNA-binding protein n=2 Tax=Capnocytophaga canimorsus TaxID=28188 RepID=F9YR61_CAPCC|nr:DNA-binding protein [Capnocytophaga canimorsus]AEK22419.1 Putative DNA-binding protein [Capnocytophaga canimorsus Cc5]ATA77600.1 DNA-binding protein [Capnocytophaga canimorsus]ATA92234.1 DNA-binding protein [Capnocytophaga canimorsus]ATA94347.1 DNA-binding protein [Capnocytophaga canimorsus]AWL79071.1 DNA-binding protein [Capnocytophaga canimorsus]